MTWSFWSTVWESLFPKKLFAGLVQNNVHPHFPLCNPASNIHKIVADLPQWLSERKRTQVNKAVKQIEEIKTLIIW